VRAGYPDDSGDRAVRVPAGRAAVSGGMTEARMKVRDKGGEGRVCIEMPDFAFFKK
jgi:hypothetical protein